MRGGERNGILLKRKCKLQLTHNLILRNSARKIVYCMKLNLHTIIFQVKSNRITDRQIFCYFYLRIKINIVLMNFTASFLSLPPFFKFERNLKGENFKSVGNICTQIDFKLKFHDCKK